MNTTPISIPPSELSKPMNRLLSIDGGGIKALISIAILKRIEQILGDRYADQYTNGASDFRLCHYFNFIGGTSAGSILAAYLATGGRVKDIRPEVRSGKTLPVDIETEFRVSAREMFATSPVWRKPQYRYKGDALSQYLRERFQRRNGERTLVMGDPEVETLLMIVALNASTGSTWPIFNNPEAKYSNMDWSNTNLSFPLCSVVRSSTAAPTFFPPESLPTDDTGHEFVDGGVTSLNNPSYQMFLQATVPSYHVEMPRGLDKMLLVSVGTGQSKTAYPFGTIGEMHQVESAQLAIQSLMDTSSVLQDVFCRDRGAYLNHHQQPVDSELGAMAPATLDEAREKDFYYLRYNPFLVKDGGRIDPGNPKKDSGHTPRHASLDSLKEMPYLTKAGEQYAEQGIAEGDLPPGPLFPNARSPQAGQAEAELSTSGLTIVNKGGEFQKLRHFGGDRKFFDEEQEASLVLKEAESPESAPHPQRWRFYLSFVWPVLTLLTCFWVALAQPDWIENAKDYFREEPSDATLDSTSLRRMLWFLIGVTTTFFTGGLTLNFLISAKKNLTKVGFMVATLVLAAVTAWVGSSFFESLDSASTATLKLVSGFAVCLLVTCTAATWFASLLLVWYRRWIAGAVLVLVMPFLFMLAAIFHLTWDHSATAVCMLLGLIVAFAGIHLTFWGRPARIVFVKPKGK